MSKKVLGSICVILLFILAVNFYTQKSDAQSMVAKMKILEQENATLRKERNKLKIDQRQQEKREIITVAKLFKMMEYTVPYDEDHSFDIHEEQINIRRKFHDYATENEMMQLPLEGTARYLDLVQDTNSKITIKDISIKQFDINTEADEVTLDYTIDFVFDPIKKGRLTQTIAFFGQMRLIETDKGWKVDDDNQQFINVREINERLDN